MTNNNNNENIEIREKLIYISRLENNIKILISNFEEYLSHNDMKDAVELDRKINQYFKSIKPHLEQIKKNLSDNKIKKLLGDEITIFKKISKFLKEMLKNPAKIESYKNLIDTLEDSLEKIKKEELKKLM